jgi:hypothetical protein
MGKKYAGNKITLVNNKVFELLKKVNAQKNNHTPKQNE